MSRKWHSKDLKCKNFEKGTKSTLQKDKLVSKRQRLNFETRANKDKWRSLLDQIFLLFQLGEYDSKHSNRQFSVLVVPSNFIG